MYLLIKFKMQKKYNSYLQQQTLLKTHDLLLFTK